GTRSQFADPLAKRMAHVGAVRAVEPRECRGLERQDRQHLVDIRAHRARAPRPPGPNRRRGVVDDRNTRRGLAHTARDPMCKVRAVDDDQCVGTGRDHGVRRLPDAPQDERQFWHDCADSQDREFIHGEKTGEAARCHVTPADAAKGDIGPQGTHRIHQRAAEHIAGLFRRHEKELVRKCHYVDRSALMPTTKILALSAAVASAAGWATIEPPATTAIPASPARAVSSTVRGPMAGRSKRRSCCGFGALTRTPVPDGAAMRPAPRGWALGPGCAWVPSAASTASTLFSATTAACPMSNGPVAVRS